MSIEIRVNVAERRAISRADFTNNSNENQHETCCCSCCARICAFICNWFLMKGRGGPVGWHSASFNSPTTPSHLSSSVSTPTHLSSHAMSIATIADTKSFESDEFSDLTSRSFSTTQDVQRISRVATRNLPYTKNRCISFP